MISFLLLLLKELVAPPFCAGCGKYGTMLCQNCYRQINFVSVCPDLDNMGESLDQLLVMAWFEGVLKKMILALKYQKAKDLGVVLANLCWWSMALPQVDLVTYVPCSDKRIKERGYNQTQEIAQVLAERLELKCLPLVVKVKDTVRQATLKTTQERANNLAGSFILNPKLDRETLRGKRILVIDDVVTTGATLAEVATVLKKYQASKVVALAMAHGN